jgi:tetratricopeptide (TPR) repeat protein
MPRLVAAACLLLAWLAAAQPALARSWSRLDTPHFIVIGNAGGRQLRQVAERLEEFRQVFSQMFPTARVTTGLPTVVLVFGDDRSFGEFLPPGVGKDARLGGLFVPGEQVDYISLKITGSEQGYHVVFHELTHQLVNNAMASVPLWFNEGLAEYYSTFTVAGGKASVGMHLQHHVDLLRRRGPALADLIGSNQSPLEGGELARSLLYARAWGFVHFLLTSDPPRVEQLQDYLDRTGRNVPARQAFTEAFRATPEQVEAELRLHLSQRLLRYFLFPLTEKVARARFEPRPIGEAEAEAWLGGFLVQLRRFDDARARLSRALALAPEHPQVHRHLGALSLAEGRFDEAHAALGRAATLAPDDFLAHYYHGHSLVRALGGPRDAAALQRAAQARAALRHAVTLHAEAPMALSLLAFAALYTGEGLEEARELATRAIRLAPGKDQHRLVLAQVLVALGDGDAVRQLLGPILASTASEPVKARARDVLARLSAASDATSRRDSMEVFLPQPEGSHGEASSWSPNEQPVILDLRVAQSGETQSRGVLERVDCTDDTFLLQVRVDGEMRRITAIRGVTDFITYRPAAPPQFDCGPRDPAEDILVTVGSDGIAVAVELLPDGFLGKTPPRE